MQLAGIDDRLRASCTARMRTGTGHRGPDRAWRFQARRSTGLRDGLWILAAEVAMRSVHPKMSTVTYQVERRTFVEAREHLRPVRGQASDHEHRDQQQGQGGLVGLPGSRPVAGGTSPASTNSSTTSMSCTSTARDRLRLRQQHQQRILARGHCQGVGGKSVTLVKATPCTASSPGYTGGSRPTSACLTR